MRRITGIKAGALAAAVTAAVALAVPAPATGTAGTVRTVSAGSAAHAGAATAVCPGVPAPSAASAAPDAPLDAMFGNYADHGAGYDHWTGADSTYSAPLPRDHELWIFSDTFLGYVNPDGSRSPVISDKGTTPFINNSFVAEPGRVPDPSGAGLTTIGGGTAADPAALMPPPDATHWYWAGDAVVAGGTLQAVYQEYDRFGSAPFDFAWERNVLARYHLGDLSHPFGVQPLPSSAGIAWGSWIARDGGYTYVYGVEDLGADTYMHIARVAGDDLLRPWQYYTAAGTWSPDESASARIAGPAASGGFLHVASEYSVSRVGRLYVLVTQNTLQPFSAEIDVLYSCSPVGPFTDRTAIYDTPETGLHGSYGDANVYTYNAHAHPQISAPGRLVISYNVNSLVNTDLYKNASIYRPRFIELTLGPVTGRQALRHALAEPARRQAETMLEWKPLAPACPETRSRRNRSRADGLVGEHGYSRQKGELSWPRVTGSPRTSRSRTRRS